MKQIVSKTHQVFYYLIFCFLASIFFISEVAQAYDITTASPVGNSFSFLSQTGDPRDFVFSDSGSKLYINNFGGDLYQYTLSTPYDISTLEYGDKTYDTSKNGLSAISINNEGTVLFALFFYDATIYQYNLSTPYDISTATYDSSFSLSGYSNNYHFGMKPDGTKMYVLSDYNNYIVQYSLSSAWDLSTASYESRITIPVSSGVDGQRLVMNISPNGEHIYIETTNTELIHHLTLSTPWDVTSTSYTGSYLSFNSYDTSVRGIDISSDGDTFWMLGTQNDTIYDFHLNKPIVETLSPADDAVNVAVDSNLVITFNEAISTSTGSFILKKTSDDSTFEVFLADSDQLSKTGGTTIVIDPTTNLDDDTSYYLTASSTIIVSDSSEKYYAGISNNSTWNFETIDNNAPSVQATSLSFSSVDYSSLTLSWVNGNGDGRVIFAKQASSGTSAPVDSTTYAANSVFGSGDQIGTSGWYAIYNSTSDVTTMDVSGLSPNTDYIFHIVEYDLSGSNELYQTSSALNNPNTQTSAVLLAPTTQATNVSFSSVDHNSIDISWTRGDGEKVKVFVKQASAGTASPVDGTTYSANSTFGSGTQIGTTGWYAVYDGTGTSVSVSGLAHSTDYIVQVFEYNGLTTGLEKYLTSTALDNPNTTTTYTPVMIYANSSTGNDTSGDGSLVTPYKTFHKAYTEANSGDTINLTGTFTWTDADETGDVQYDGYTINKSLTIEGRDAEQTIIQSTDTDNTADRRIFTFNSGYEITLQKMTLRFGKVSGSSRDGGCLLNNATTTVAYINIHNCRSTGSYGGGISNSGELIVNNSTIHDNTVYYAGGGIANDYGATGNLTVTNSTIYSNLVTAGGGAFYGGGIFVAIGDATLTNNTIINNRVTNGIGGGLHSHYDAGSLYVKNNIIANNTAHYSGTNDFKAYGGTVNDNGYNIVGPSESFDWSVATGGWEDDDGNGTFELNGVGTTGTLNFDTEAGINDDPYRLKTYALLSGSIAINNATTTVNNTVSVPSTDQRGATRNGLTDIGAFEYDGSLSISEPTVQASSISTSTVEYNQMTISWTSGNGSRRTVFAKQANTGTASPVDTTRYSASATFGSGDQIGVTGWYAIYDGLGSSVTVTNLSAGENYIFQVFEYNGVTTGAADYMTASATDNPLTQSTYSPITLYANSSTGNDSSGDGSSSSPYKTFHKIYTEANSGDTIDLSGTFTWTDADETGDTQYDGYTIAKDLFIRGNGPDNTIVQSDSTDNTSDRRVFTFTTASTTIKSLTLRYGKVSSTNSGGCVELDNNDGALTIRHTDIYSCRTTGGVGAVHNRGSMEIYNSSIHDNTVYYGGGGVSSSPTDSGNLILVNNTIYSNLVTSSGGAFYGGGVYIANGNATLTNNTIVNNTVTNGIGGGVLTYNTGEDVYLKNNIIANNNAWYSGTKDWHAYAGTIHSSYNIIGRSESYSWQSTGDWTDSNGDGTFVLYDIGTTGTLNLDTSAALNDNPYKTYTYALLAESIAINNGSSVANNEISIPNTDQRTGARVEETDIGAFEYGYSFVDTTAPTVSSLSPVDNATGVSVTTNLTITFNEDIATSSGNVVIYRASDDSVVEIIDITSSQVTNSGTDALVVNPSVTFASETEYYILIDSTAVDDTSGNSFAGVSSVTYWSFTTADTELPTITSISSDKANATYGVGEVIDIDVTFSEAVTSTGNVTVTLETGDTDRTCTFTVSSATTGTCNYTVQAGDNSSDLSATVTGVIKDAANNTLTNFTPTAGLSASKALAIDTTAPTATLSPLDNATEVDIDSNLTITFSEAVDAESGDIVLYKASDDSIVESFDVTSDITGSGSTLITINPSLDLDIETEYYVVVPITAFDDSVANSYAGIIASSSWSFTTGTPACPTVANAATYNSYPTCGVATCNSGYNLTDGACVISSSNTYTPPVSVGNGIVNNTIGIGKTKTGFSISESKANNFLVYINSEIGFTCGCKNHNAKITDLNMITKEVTINFDDNIIKLFPGDSKVVDNTKVTYNELFKNRVDLTMEQVSKEGEFGVIKGGNIDIDKVFFKAGDLVKEFNNPTVYLVENSKKRPILNEKVFLLNGFKWGNILEYKDLSLLETGEMFSEMPNKEKDTILSSLKLDADLEYGMKDSLVINLQKILNQKGYIKSGPGSRGLETDYFGNITKEALIKFQKDNNINPAQGYCGPITRGFLIQ